MSSAHTATINQLRIGYRAVGSLSISPISAMATRDDMEQSRDEGTSNTRHIHAAGSRLSSQCRNIIMNVFQYFTSQRPSKTMKEIIKATATATQVSERTIYRIKSEKMKSSDGIIHSPLPRKRKSTVVDHLDSFDRECVRREILSFYDRGDLPTLANLLAKVREPPTNFTGSRSSLYKIVRNLGFRYKKVTSGRKILMERQDIIVTRNKYLRELKRNRESPKPRPEVFVDETWVNQNLTVEKCWTNEDGSVGPKTKSGRGSRFIIVHAGSDEGFVPGALLMFKSKNGSKGDYHDSMDNERFKMWLEEQLLPNIKKESLIIIDNAPYHSKIINKVPTSSNRKAQIIDWLVLNNIDHDPSVTKLKLLQLCQRHKEIQKYEIDEIAAHYGHKVLRLPPYHCIFNPIELIWAQVKTEIKKRNSNSDQSLKIVEKITKEAVDHVTPQHWQNAIEHVKRIEEVYRAKDSAFDKLLDEFVIDLNDSTTDDSSDEDALTLD